MPDLLWRIGYRVAFRAARLVWRIRRPSHVGAVLAAWLGDQILVVRQSYRNSPYWPGGGVSAVETPVEAIRRELREELGVIVSEDQLTLVREMSVEWEYRYEQVSIFETRFQMSPDLRIDNREIVAAEFVDPRSLLKRDDLPPYIRTYLEERLGHGNTPRASPGR